MRKLIHALYGAWITNQIMIIMKFYILLLLAIFQVTAQPKISVVYNSVILDLNDTYGAFSVETCTLISTASESIYEIRYRDTIFEHPTLGHFESGKTDMVKKIYKDLDSHYVYYEAPWIQEIVKDDGYSPNWTLNENSKKILGYTCQEATTSWRGRNYKAYFAPEIPISNGPFKFDGLPGLILEVVSDNQALKITAKSIQKTEEPIINPFIGQKTISWTEFLKSYRTFFDKVANISLAENSYTNIPKRDIEIYVE